MKLAALFVLVASVVHAQVPFPEAGVDIVHKLYAGVNPQDDDARRVAVRRTCEQLALDLGPRWGGKKRTGLSDDSRSPDSLAWLEDDGSVSVWDIQTSSGFITVTTGKLPDYVRLSPSEAAFMPCEPTNHLNVQPPSPPPVPTPAPAPPPIGLPLELFKQAVREVTEPRFVALEQQLERHDKSPSWMAKYVGNPWSLAGIIGAIMATVGYQMNGNDPGAK